MSCPSANKERNQLSTPHTRPFAKFPLTGKDFRAVLFLLLENHSLLTRCHKCSIDAHGLTRFLALGVAVIDYVRHFNSFSYSAKGRKLSIQMMTIPDKYEEMRGCA